ncbi:hypothetical protein ACPRNU_06145 [Chromobacterium vaccinii]|uniref:hypothetical protein n=1 Tax=Chromobacterium TaxID=535 RepID=UPI0013054233|nr:hypothetical protein [Chromobacterium sp. ATCC 53434]
MRGKWPLLRPSKNISEDVWLYPGWEDTALIRLKAFLLLQGFNSILLSTPCLTDALQAWCRNFRIVPQPRVILKHDKTAFRPAPTFTKEQLRLKDGEVIHHCRAVITCANLTLASIDHWYPPNRISNHQAKSELAMILQASLRRELLESKILWTMLPSHLDPIKKNHSLRRLRIPRRVLQHYSILYGSDNHPYCLALENYMNGIFAFPLNSFS